MRLCGELVWSSSPQATHLDTKQRWFAAYVKIPFIASGVFAVCFSRSIRSAIATMPTAARMPGDQLLQFADDMWWWTYSVGLAVAFVGIHALAFANKAFTASLWHLFSLLSPAGAVPPLRWFVWRASSAWVCVGLLFFASGLLFPSLRPRAPPLALETRVRDHAATFLLILLLLSALRWLRDRRLVVVDRNIWGHPIRATTAMLIRVAVLLATMGLLTMVSPALAW